MFNISSYLEKFKKIDFGDVGVKDIVASAIKDVVGASIERKHIKIQNQTAYITSNPTLKNQLAIKREAVLIAILSKTNRIKDIR